MSKTHASLSPRANLLLIPVWAAVSAGLLVFAEPRPPIALVVVGAVLGAIGGSMQHLSLKQASDRFSAALSFLDVRRAFTGTVWGRRYIIFLYVSKAVLGVMAFWMVRQSFLGVILGYLAGYFALMFVREIVTLPDALFLSRLPRGKNDGEEETAS